MEIHTETAVIGAGLTGLTTAFYLNKRQKEFMVLEVLDTVGGVICTRQENGFVYEAGPNTGVIGQPEVVELFRDLEGLVELEKANKSAKKRYVLKGGVWHSLPMGLKSAITTPLFDWKDKIRILGEPFRAKGKNPEETLRELVLRRMGRSFLDYAVDPFILGIYAGDPARLIPRYALPKLYRLEQDYGSFILGALRKAGRKKTGIEKEVTREVFSVKGGLGKLCNALLNSAGPQRFITGAGNCRAEPESGGYRIVFQKDGVVSVLHCKNVISTVGAYALPELFPFFPKEELSLLTSLRYAGVAEIVLGFNKWKGMKPDGFGGLIPFRETRDILGVLFISSFLEGRAPAGGALFSVFVGGIRRPGLYALEDASMIELVRREFTELMGISGFSPDLLKIFRYEHAIPQYEAGSGERFEAIFRLEKMFPGLILGGNPSGGIGMADRIKQAVSLAGRVQPEKT